MAGDVVDLILADHRRFEDLLHELRNVEADRTAVMTELADLLVAHAEAEERWVYPVLRYRDAIDREEAKHGKHEHAEGHEALLALLEVGDPDAEGFDDAVEDLTKELSHHLDEEERDVLNPARTDVDEEVRQDLGVEFMEERQRLLDSHAGSIDNVRRLVREAREDDLI